MLQIKTSVKQSGRYFRMVEHDIENPLFAFSVTVAASDVQIVPILSRFFFLSREDTSTLLFALSY